MNLFYQIGGVKCSLCGSEGTNISTCPCNPKATNPNYEKHYNWQTCMEKTQVPQKIEVVPKKIIKKQKMQEEIKKPEDIKKTKEIRERVEIITKKITKPVPQKKLIIKKEKPIAKSKGKKMIGEWPDPSIKNIDLYIQILVIQLEKLKKLKVFEKCVDWINNTKNGIKFKKVILMFLDIVFYLKNLHVLITLL